MTESLERGDEVYVFATFMSPQKHCYLVSQKGGSDGSNISCTLQTQIIGVREEPVPYFCKAGKTRQIEIVGFEKEKSVFKAWGDDTSYLDVHDFPRWKVPRLLKAREDEISLVKSFFKKHQTPIRDLFMHL